MAPSANSLALGYEGSPPRGFLRFYEKNAACLLVALGLRVLLI